MSAVRIDMTGVDFSIRAMKIRFKRASEKAFLRHRSQTMPRHFQPIAFRIYSKAYTRPSTPQSAAKSRTAGRSRTDKRDVGRVSATKAQRANPRPLVRTGRLENAVLNGHVKLFGAAGKTQMVWGSLPHYTFINPLDQANKVEQLEIILPIEEQLIATNIEKNLEEEFNK